MVRKKVPAQKIANNEELDISLQDVANGVEDELLVIDKEHHINFANLSVQRHFQKEAESLIGKTCYQVLYNRDKPCASPLWQCPLSEVCAKGKMITVIHPASINGTMTHLKITAYPLRDKSGNIKAIVELRKDVTAERELESHILRQHHELLALSRVSAALSGLWDLDAILRVALDNILKIMNGTNGGILLFDEPTQTLSYRVHQGLSDQYVKGIRLRLGDGIAGMVAQSGKSLLLEDISLDSRSANPDLISTEGLKAFISVPLRAKDKVLGVMNVASKMPRQFTENDMHLLNSVGDQLGVAIEQAKLYERLVKARERYQKLARQTLVTQEEERKRLARELHDEYGQTLTGLIMSIESSESMITPGQSQLRNKLANTKSLLVRTLGDMRKLTFDLRPSSLDDLGLVATIRAYIQSHLEEAGMQVKFKNKGISKRLAPELEIALFRIIQEATHNVVKHAQASSIEIELISKNGKIVVIVKDDGRGFNTDTVLISGNRIPSAGIIGIRERVQLLGGTFSIKSNIGGGTRLEVEIPTVDASASGEHIKGTSSEPES